jgi:hypothetical protein
MMLRLVLVGIVAGLGVTIPSRPIGTGWLGSAERWANSVLADWDTWRPSDSDGRGHLVVSVHDCEQCKLARAAIVSREQKDPAVASLQTTKWAPVNSAPDENKPAAPLPAASVSNQSAAVASAFDPMKVGDEFYTAVAFELNSKAEGLEPAPPAALPVAIAAEVPPLAASQDLELDLPEVLCGTSDEEAAEFVFIREAAAARPANPASSSDALASTEPPSEPDFDEMGEVEIGETVPLPAVAVSERVPASVDSSERPEVIANDEHGVYEDEVAAYRDGRDLTVYAQRSPSPIATLAPALPAPSTPSMQLPAAPVPLSSPTAIGGPETPALSNNPAELPWPAFAPEEPIAQSPPHMVQETTIPWSVFAPVDFPISREVIAATEHPSAIDVPTSHDHSSSRITPGSPTEAGWGHAVKLTRQAVNAWLSVLAPSAPVEVTAAERESIKRSR